MLEFISFVENECKKYNIKFILSEDQKVDQGDGLGCSGFFDEPTKTLAVAKGFNGWQSILVHEYGHMTQWIDNSVYWTNRGERHNWFWKWIAGEVEMDRDMVSTEMWNQLLVEYDCEKRSLELIKNHNLPIDQAKYIKGANSYILFYTFINMYGKWYDEKPYNVPEILDLMPDTLMPIDWYKNLNPEYESLIFNKCINENDKESAIKNCLDFKKKEQK